MEKQNKTILIAEKDKEISNLKTKYMIDKGYNVINSYSEEDTIEFLKKDNNIIDLIIMDIEISNIIEKINIDIPIIFILSNEENEIIEKFDKSDSYLFISKNIELPILNSYIKKSIKLHKKNNQLQENERNYKNFFDNFLLGIFKLNAKGKFISVNSSFATMFGYDSPQDFILSVNNSSPDIIFSSPYNFLGLLNLILEKPKQSIEISFNKKNGDSFIGKIYPTYQKDYKGNILFIEGFIEDITKEKLEQEILIKKENQLRIITDSLPVHIFYVGLDDLKYRFVNVNFKKTFGIPSEKIIGKNINEILGESNYQLALKYIDEVSKGHEFSYENTFNLT